MEERVVNSSDRGVQKVAIFVWTPPQLGGGHSYELEVVKILADLLGDQVVLMVPSARINRGQWRRYAEENGVTVMFYPTGLRLLVGTWLRSSFLGYFLLRFVGFRLSRSEKRLKKAGVCLAYFASPNPYALSLVDIPFVSTLWDLGHRELPEYPEMSANRKFEEREYYFTRTLPKSVRVVTDSAATTDLVARVYGVDTSRCISSGLLPGQMWTPSASRNSTTDLDMGDEMNSISDLPTRFFMYPAQFWPHKNHSFLLNLLRELRHIGREECLVLTGSDRGSLDSFLRLVEEMNLASDVFVLGFVETEQLQSLYRMASCVVFPSRLGPTNLPPLEAVSTGCPVIADAKSVAGLPPSRMILPVESECPVEWAKALISLDEISTSSRRELAAQFRDVLKYEREEFRMELAVIFKKLGFSVTA